MKPHQCLTIVGLCVFSVWHTAIDAAGGDLSRGRQILLDRGLQIQALAFTGVSDQSYGIWPGSNFTSIGDVGTPVMEIVPYRLGPNQAWSRWCNNTLPATQSLTSDEMTYVNNFVSFQYDDELANINDPAMQTTLAATYRRWNASYPNAIAYTNNYPAQLNASQLRSYMQTTQPDMIMFDYYPDYSFGTSERNTWYSAMQQYRTAGLAGNDGTGQKPIPYAQYLNLYRSSYTAATPSESFVRLQQNASWAFGYSFLTAYQYNEGHGIYPAMFNPQPAGAPGNDFSPNAVFDYVAETNRQSRNLGPALTRLVSTDIRMRLGQHQETGTHWWGGHYTRDVTNDLPRGISEWSPDAVPYITGISVTNLSGMNNSLAGDVLVGTFKPLDGSFTNPGHASDAYFMIVNGLIDATGLAADCRQLVHVSFDFGASGINGLQRLSRLTGQVETIGLVHGIGSQYSLDLYLDGGTGDLFKFNNGGTFVPEPGTYVLVVTWLAGLLPYGWRKRKQQRASAVGSH